MNAAVESTFYNPSLHIEDSPLTDEELLIEYRRTGVRELFTQLVQRYERELYSYLRRYLGDAEMAEDVFQATFLQIHLKCSQFDSNRSFRPWLYTVATNQAIDAQRRNRRHRLVSLDRVGNSEESEDVGRLMDLLVSEVPDPIVRASKTEERQWVGDAMDDLSDQMRAVVNLVYYEGMKYREAADVLSIPVGTVKSRLHSAIAKLTELWNDSHVEQS